MKTLYLYTLLFFYSVLGYAQNLVPNPSFENLSQCPFSLGLEAYISDWKSARETPDYFNTCATSVVADVPNNNFGYQQPYLGNAYIGMLTYRSDSSLYTEAASVQLTSPLIIGQTYYISFRLNLTIDNFTESNSANNKIGIQFSTVNYNPSSPIPVNNFAHVWSDSIITDTLNWSVIRGSFVADSAYAYLVLGNFFDKTHIDSIVYGSNFGAYYYFDDVCVSSDSLTCSQSVGINNSLLNEFNFDLYPNPTENFVYIKNNSKTDFRIEVYNSLGQLLTKKKKTEYDELKLDLSEFADGVLFIKVISSNSQTVYKIHKQ